MACPLSPCTFVIWFRLWQGPRPDDRVDPGLGQGVASGGHGRGLGSRPVDPQVGLGGAAGAEDRFAHFPICICCSFWCRSW